MSVYYPDAARFGDYEANVRQGVVGGIPTRSGGAQIQVTNYGWSAENTAAQNSSALEYALSISAAGDVVHLPAGTFAVNTITLDYLLPGRTIRGAGMGVTTLQFPGDAFYIGDGSSFGNEFNPVSTITSMTAGSAVITLSDASSFPSPSTQAERRVGKIYLADEITTPVVSVYNFPYIRRQTATMVSRSGNNITLSQPLPSSYALGASGAYFELGHQLVRHTYGVGVESMSIESPATSAVQVKMSDGCWLKDLHISGYTNRAIFVYDSTNVEIRGCHCEGPGGTPTNQAGMLLESITNSLIEDNIVSNNFPDIEINHSSVNNVIASNYFAGVLNSNHGPHNAFNLFEGNSYHYIQWDGYFGGASQETAFRDWMRAGDVFTSQKRFTRNVNLVGNIVGTPGVSYSTDGSEHWGDPNISNNTSVGTAQLSDASPWADWDSSNGRPYIWTGTLTTRTSDTAGVITLGTGQGAVLATAITDAFPDNHRGMALDTASRDIVHNAITVTDITGDVVTFDTGSGTNPDVDTEIILTPGPPGFQEKDLDVAATAIRKANYFILTGDIPAGESLGGDTIPASYFRSAKPSWFGSLAWPSFDSSSPGTPAADSFPAGWRFTHGNSSYLGSGEAVASITATTVNVGTVNIG